MTVRSCASGSRARWHSARASATISSNTNSRSEGMESPSREYRDAYCLASGIRASTSRKAADGGIRH